MSNVLGIGTDIVEVKRIRKSIDEHKERFVNRLFTPQERAYCDKHADPIPHYAARFAAKEAVVKALGAGFGEKISWHDIEIINDPSGKPTVHCSQALNQNFNSPTLLLSLSHEKEYVTATALWLANNFRLREADRSAE